MNILRTLRVPWRGALLALLATLALWSLAPREAQAAMLVEQAAWRFIETTC